MRIWTLMLALSFMLPSFSEAAPRSRVHDLMPSYWRFMAKAKGSPAASQQAWTRYYYLPNRKTLGDVECPTLASGRLPASIADLANLEPAMSRASATLEKTLPGALDRFDRYFPDNAWRGEIFVMSSLGCFDGRAQSIGGHPAMLLGIDVIASTGNTEPAVLLTHELFHLYHRQFFKPAGDPLWASLWSEGLATYASEVLNPGALLDALLLPPAMVKAVEQDRARLVADLASHLDESGSRAETLYFRTDDRTEPVPPRAGYYLGLLVARQLAAQGHDVKALAHWDAPTAEAFVRATLPNLAAAK